MPRRQITKQPKVHPYPFMDLVHKRGQTARLLWEIPGPANTDIAWLSCYVIGRGIVIVETFYSSGFEALTSGPSVDVPATIDDVLNRCGIE